MKKLVSVLLVFVMCISLAACGKSQETAKEEKVTQDNSTENEAKKNESEPAKQAEQTNGQQAAVTEPVTITFSNFNSSGANEGTLEKMYEEFHKEYPNITVEIETIGYDDYFTQMQTRVAGGTAPDCYELNIENFAAYANKGVLAEITGVDMGGFNQTALKAFEVKGAQYGVPGCLVMYSYSIIKNCLTGPVSAILRLTGPGRMYNPLQRRFEHSEMIFTVFMLQLHIMSSLRLLHNLEEAC